MRVLFLASLLSLSMCFAFASVPAPAQVSMQQMLVEQENVQLFSDMRHVSNWINQYCIWNHRFPEQGDEMREAKSQLNQLIPNNPYVNNKLELSQGLDADPVYLDPSNSPTYPTDYQKVTPFISSDTAANLKRVKLVLNQSMTELDINEWRKNPPDEWQEPAGTITVISNQTNLFVVWAAAADGKPLRNPVSGVTELIIGRYALLNDTQE